MSKQIKEITLGWATVAAPSTGSNPEDVLERCDRGNRGASAALFRVAGDPTTYRSPVRASGGVTPKAPLRPSRSSPLGVGLSRRARRASDRRGATALMASGSPPRSQILNCLPVRAPGDFSGKAPRRPSRSPTLRTGMSRRARRASDRSGVTGLPRSQATNPRSPVRAAGGVSQNAPWRPSRPMSRRARCASGRREATTTLPASVSLPRSQTSLPRRRSPARAPGAKMPSYAYGSVVKNAMNRFSMPATKPVKEAAAAARMAPQNAPRLSVTAPGPGTRAGVPRLFRNGHKVTPQARPRGKRCRSSGRTSQPNEGTVSFRVLHLNCCGVVPKTTEIAKMLNDAGVHVALLQETLHCGREVRVPGYSAYKCDCRDCRGVVILARNDVSLGAVRHERHVGTETQRATVFFGGQQFDVWNVYCAPKTTMDLRLPTGLHFERTIIAGDFNGHSPRWGYADRSPNGELIETLCDSTNLVLLQTAETPPTFLHRGNGTRSRPDLSVLSGDLDWELNVLEDVGSDHLPTLVSVLVRARPSKTQPRRKWRYARADWERYRALVDEEASRMVFSGDLDEDYTVLSAAVLNAARRTIPKWGSRKVVPFWSRTVGDAVAARRRARRAVVRNASEVNRREFNRLGARAKLLVRKEKRRVWTERCSSLNLSEDSRKAWRLLDRMKGIDSVRNPPPLKAADGSLVFSDAKKAELLNRHFASVNRSSGPDRKSRRLRKAQEREAAKTTELGFTRELTLSELETAIKGATCGKAPGPDRISVEMVKNLGPVARRRLLEFFNLTWRTGTLPKAWRTATVTGVPKKDKDPGDPGSYRPISLTSCVGKIAERIINGRLYDFLERRGILSDDQGGFRRGRQTSDQIVRLLQEITDGLRMRRHTVAAFVDFRQAYDRVWRNGLLMKLLNMGIGGNLYAWIRGFLTDRLIRTRIGGALSSGRIIEEGLPQGSSLSCTLFLAFINDLSDRLNCKVAMYADDLVMWRSHPKVELAAGALKCDLAELDAYCDRWRIAVNTTKTVYSVFTLSHLVRRSRFEFFLAGKELRKDDSPVYLGVRLDPSLTLRRHFEEQAARAAQRLNLLKKLASTRWGARFDTLKRLYVGYVRSVLEYALPIAAFTVPTNLKPIERIHNAALRFLCGGPRTTPTNACEVVAGVEPMALRRDHAILSSFERYRRLPRGDRRREMVELWWDNRRLKRGCFVREANRLTKDAGLPSDPIEELRRVPVVPPHDAPPPPTIIPHLNEVSAHKGIHPLELKRLAEETIESYPGDAIRAYTDGSATTAAGLPASGYGVLLEFPDGSHEKDRGGCGRYRSNYEAEALAIHRAIVGVTNWARKRTQRGIEITSSSLVIFSDARSVLCALMDWSKSLKDPILGDIARVMESLRTKFGISTVLQWIPGHCGIPGNERADRLAKRGTSKPIPSGLPQDRLSLAAVKALGRDALRRQWLAQWAVSDTGKSVRHYMVAPDGDDAWRSLPRGDQTVVFNLRTGHAPLRAHLRRIDPQRDATCRRCGAAPESIDHVLWVCPAVGDQRSRWLPATPDKRQALYGSRSQLRRTAAFFKDFVGDQPAD